MFWGLENENQDKIKKFILEAPIRKNVKLVLYYKDGTQKTIKTKYPSDDFVGYICKVANISDDELFELRFVCNWKDASNLKLDFYIPQKIREGMFDFFDINKG